MIWLSLISVLFYERGIEGNLSVKHWFYSDFILKQCLNFHRLGKVPEHHGRKQCKWWLKENLGSNIHSAVGSRILGWEVGCLGVGHGKATFSYSSFGMKSTEGGAFVLPRIRGRNITMERRPMPRTARSPHKAHPQCPSSWLSSLFPRALLGCVCLEVLCKIPSFPPPGIKAFFLRKKAGTGAQQSLNLICWLPKRYISANQEQHQQDPWQASQNPRKNPCHFMVLAQPQDRVHLMFFLEQS